MADTVSEAPQTAAAPPQNGSSTSEPLFESVPPQLRPGRRIAILTAMAERPDRVWEAARLRKRLISLKTFSDSPKDTHSFHNLLNRLKQRGEVERVDDRGWRVTAKGLAAVGR